MSTSQSLASSKELKTLAHEKNVYLALKFMFTGTNANIRQPKAIRNSLLRYPDHVEIKKLVMAYGIEAICETARVLLVEEVFRNDDQAKLRFSALATISPGQGVGKVAPNKQGTRVQPSAATTIQTVNGGVKVAVQTAGTTNTENAVRTVQTAKPPISKDDRVAPLLTRIYLPFKSQHLLLGKVQELLERACYVFAQRAMPDVLQKNRWDCAQAVELNIWTAEFLKHLSILAERPTQSGYELTQVLQSVANIRHAAVHRLRVDAMKIKQFCTDAASLLEAMDDKTCRRSLVELQDSALTTITAIECKKKALSLQLTEKLGEIAAKRAQLERSEQEIISEMLRVDDDFQKTAGQCLELDIESLEDNHFTDIITEDGAASDMNVSDSAEE